MGPPWYSMLPAAAARTVPLVGMMPRRTPMAADWSVDRACVAEATPPPAATSPAASAMVSTAPRPRRKVSNMTAPY